MNLSKEIYSIPLKDINISQFNVRLTDKKAEIKELAESIKRHGLIQPVILRGKPEHPPYELIIGQRRFRAHQELNEKNIRAIFCQGLGDVEAKILSLSENMQRVELNHADKAEAITALYLHFHKDERRVASELDLHLRTVRDYISIEERATKKGKKMLKVGNITKADLKRVIDAAQGDDNKADRLLDILPNLTKYEKSRAVNYGKVHKEATADKIIEEAKKQKIEHTVILNLNTEINEALGKAEEKLLMDKESIATKALSEWLENNGFLQRNT
jgi:ParB/RepB/Spo0J family partition protein